MFSEELEILKFLPRFFSILGTFLAAKTEEIERAATPHGRKTFANVALHTLGVSGHCCAAHELFEAMEVFQNLHQHRLKIQLMGCDAFCTKQNNV